VPSSEGLGTTILLSNAHWFTRIRWWVVAVNILFSLLAHKLSEDSPLISLRVQLWLQILVDLLAVTVVVHKVGSIDTFISFAYIFHIVRAGGRY